MDDIKMQIENLNAVYGPEKVRKAARELLAAYGRPIPAEHIPVIAPDKVARTVEQLETALEEIVKSGEAKEIAYQNKADLMKQKTELETAIKLTEAEAFMDIQGEGRDQYVIENGKKIVLNNDAARDAFRRRASADERRQAAAVNAEISAIDVELARANDVWFTAKEAVETIRAKANLQAALLNFLSGRAC